MSNNDFSTPEARSQKEPFDLNGESKQFAFHIINAYQFLTEKTQRREYNLSKVLLLKGAAIGDCVRQRDYLGAYNAASSTKYYIELEMHGGYLSEPQATQLLDECVRLVKYLYVAAHPETRRQKKEREEGTV